MHGIALHIALLEHRDPYPLGGRWELVGAEGWNHPYPLGGGGLGKLGTDTYIQFFYSLTRSPCRFPHIPPRSLEATEGTREPQRPEGQGKTGRDEPSGRIGRTHRADALGGSFHVVSVFVFFFAVLQVLEGAALFYPPNLKSNTLKIISGDPLASEIGPIPFL